MYIGYKNINLAYSYATKEYRFASRERIVWEGRPPTLKGRCIPGHLQEHRSNEICWINDPDSTCACGIYSLKSYGVQELSYYGAHTIAIANSGKIIEGEIGYKSTQATILGIVALCCRCRANIASEIVIPPSEGFFPAIAQLVCDTCYPEMKYPNIDNLSLRQLCDQLDIDLIVPKFAVKVCQTCQGTGFTTLTIDTNISNKMWHMIIARVPDNDSLAKVDKTADIKQFAPDPTVPDRYYIDIKTPKAMPPPELEQTIFQVCNKCKGKRTLQELTI